MLLAIPKRERSVTNLLLTTLLATLLATLAIAMMFTSVHAGDVDVVDVQIEDLGSNQFRIDVTLKHHDEGWNHYADRWDVLAGSGDSTGELLGSRVLAHPHVNEQPFTRSLSVTIADTIKDITIRANDSVHGSNGIIMAVALPGR